MFPHRVSNFRYGHICPAHPLKAAASNAKTEETTNTPDAAAPKETPAKASTGTNARAAARTRKTADSAKDKKPPSRTRRTTKSPVGASYKRPKKK